MIKDIRYLVIITIVEYPDWGSTEVFRKLLYRFQKLYIIKGNNRKGKGETL